MIVEFLAGGFVAYTILNFIHMNRKINMVIDSVDARFATFPTPEDIAREALRVKLPLSDVPEELREKMKEILETRSQKETNKKNMGYVG